MPDLQWSGLRDAVLVAARLDWGSGSAILQMQSGDLIRIEVEEIRLVEGT